MRALGFVDLHSHILPDIDDGAADPAASLAIIRGLVGLGFDTICATPHQKAGFFLPPLDTIRARHDATVAAVREAGLQVRIPLGAENMWDDVFFERYQQNVIPSYDNGRAFLVELQLTELPTGLEDHLFRLRMNNKLPVLAHPERYQPLWKAPDVLKRLRRQCALVVDLGAVAGYHGRREARAARSMLKRGAVHAAASDAHSPEDVRAAAEGIAWIRKKLGESAVYQLLADNPRRILAGEHPGE